MILRRNVARCDWMTRSGGVKAGALGQVMTAKCVTDLVERKLTKVQGKYIRRQK